MIDDDAALLARVQQRLDELQKSERGASEQAGLSAAAIRNIREGKSKSPRLDTIRKLAPVLEVTPEWLAYGIGQLDRDATPSLIPANRSFGLARVDGQVQAGAFLQAEVFDDDRGETISAPRDPEFPYARQIAYRVAGDSMNQAQPRPIRDGDYVICVAFEDAGLEPADGMNVVVQQTINDGQLRERSVKEVRVHKDRTEFAPRSDNPAHKPIVVPKDEDPNDGREVKILALVRFVFDNVPIPIPTAARSGNR